MFKMWAKIFGVSVETCLIQKGRNTNINYYSDPNYLLQDFYDYNQFLSYADNLLLEMGLEGIYQIASFHPDYQFGGTNPHDAENYTNRSPYPLLHLIREASLERAIVEYPDVDQVPKINRVRVD